MKTRVAVLQFPGINSEQETLRALWDAQIDAELFRWNEDPTRLASYDGYVIPGGFSYEDRGRSGLIASMEPIMDEIRRQADSGKPVLGICNGAQILVESGLIPGGPGHPLLMSLARNKRIKDGKVIGVGFYNENVHIRCDAPSAFTWDYKGGEIEQVPIAHGEGRFTTSIPGLLEKLQENNQIVFRYTPTNPNGAMDNAAAICNPRGNVMAIMPHPERGPSAPMPKIFSSMKRYMEDQSALESARATAPALDFTDNPPPLTAHTHRPDTLEFFIELIITDNEAQTIQNALNHHGFQVQVRKWGYYEVETKHGEDQQIVADELIASGELCNLHKEHVTVASDLNSFPRKDDARYFLVCDKEDAAGLAKSAQIGRPTRRGWFWEVTGTVDEAALLATHIFANHHAQDIWA